MEGRITTNFFKTIKRILMYNISAHAVRQGKTIKVTVSGLMKDSSHRAIIKNFYPEVELLM